MSFVVWQELVASILFHPVCVCVCVCVRVRVFLCLMYIELCLGLISAIVAYPDYNLFFSLFLL